MANELMEYTFHSRKSIFYFSYILHFLEKRGRGINIARPKNIKRIVGVKGAPNFMAEMHEA